MGDVTSGSDLPGFGQRGTPQAIECGEGVVEHALSTYLPSFSAPLLLLTLPRSTELLAGPWAQHSRHNLLETSPFCHISCENMYAWDPQTHSRSGRSRNVSVTFLVL